MENNCLHNNPKYRCKICKSHLVCSHNIFKSKCKICNPKLLCYHKIIKYRCKECSPHLLCLHNCFRCKCNICDKEKIQNVKKIQPKKKRKLSEYLHNNNINNNNINIINNFNSKPASEYNLNYIITTNTKEINYIQNLLCMHNYQIDDCIFCFLINYK